MAMSQWLLSVSQGNNNDVYVSRQPCAISATHIGLPFLVVCEYTDLMCLVSALAKLFIFNTLAEIVRWYTSVYIFNHSLYHRTRATKTMPEHTVYIYT